MHEANEEVGATAEGIVKRVIFFAAGKNAENFADCLKEDVLLVAVTDNDALRWGGLFCGAPLISPADIDRYSYDYLVVTTPDYEGILNQLMLSGVKEEKIITPFAPERCGHRGWREVFRVGEVMYYVLERRMQRMSWVLENASYEISAGIEQGSFWRPKVQSVEETLEKIKAGCSMSRYGDGELNMILGRHYSTFQKPDEVLILRLKEILKSDLSGHIVCLPDIYGDFCGKNEQHKDWFRRHLSGDGRENDYRIFDFNKTYYNAFITRPYKDYVDKNGAGERFRALRSLWDDRDITIIEGQKTRFGVGNDLISNARSCERILGPAVNAFDKYDELLKAAKQIEKDRLILIALGHTATVLAYDLAKEGYQALDIGHLDIEYEWFLRGTDVKIPIEGKYVNEAPLGRIVAAYIPDETYNSQVIKMIV